MTKPSLLTPEELAQIRGLKGACFYKDSDDHVGALISHIEAQQEALRELRETLAPFWLHGKALLGGGMKAKSFSQIPLYSVGSSHLTACAFLMAEEALTNTSWVDEYGEEGA